MPLNSRVRYTEENDFTCNKVLDIISMLLTPSSPRSKAGLPGGSWHAARTQPAPAGLSVGRCSRSVNTITSTWGRRILAPSQIHNLELVLRKASGWPSKARADVSPVT